MAANCDLRVPPQNSLCMIVHLLPLVSPREDNQEWLDDRGGIQSLQGCAWTATWTRLKRRSCRRGNFQYQLKCLVSCTKGNNWGASLQSAKYMTSHKTYTVNFLNAAFLFGDRLQKWPLPKKHAKLIISLWGKTLKSINFRYTIFFCFEYVANPLKM